MDLHKLLLKTASKVHSRFTHFVVIKDNEPCFLVEVKASTGQGVGPSLHYFQEATRAVRAFQAVINAEFVNRNCFEYSKPIIVPASTWRSRN